MLTEAFLAFILVLLVLVTIVEKDAKDMFGPLVVGIWVGTAILAG
jgi:glycerol uptake facilitator-like aquaporin